MRRKRGSNFWDSVERGEGCWNWTASTAMGYGASWDMKTKKQGGAHRVSWKMHNGEIPAGLCVLHKCDNRLCVNPNHLFLGTKGDNLRDAIAKGRHRAPPAKHGSQHHNSILNEELVSKMRSIYRSGHSAMYISRLFILNYATVSTVCMGRSWRHVA